MRDLVQSEKDVRERSEHKNSTPCRGYNLTNDGTQSGREEKKREEPFLEDKKTKNVILL